MFLKKFIKSITPNFLLQFYYDYKNKNYIFLKKISKRDLIFKYKSF